MTAFVSYCRSDADFTLRLAADLKKGGANVWLDQLDIAPGQRWDGAVEGALTESDRVLVILSPDAVASTNVMDEVSFALEEKKAVIPVIYRDCTVPFRLRRLQYVDFRRDYERGLNDLLKTLTKQEIPAPVAAASAHAPEHVPPSPELDHGRDSPPAQRELQPPPAQPSRRDVEVVRSDKVSEGADLQELSLGGAGEPRGWNIKAVPAAIGVLAALFILVLISQSRSTNREFAGQEPVPRATVAPTPAPQPVVPPQPVSEKPVEQTPAEQIAKAPPPPNSARSKPAAENIDAREGLGNRADNKTAPAPPVRPQLLTTLVGHTGQIWDANFDATGGKVLTASEDKTARLWDAGSGKLLATFQGHTGGVSTAHFPTGGRFIVTTSYTDKTVRTWADTGMLLATLDLKVGDYIANVDPQIRHMVTGGLGNDVHVWDFPPATGFSPMTLAGHTSQVYKVRYSPAGDRIITASRDQTTRVWKAADGTLLLTLKGHTGWVFDAAFSPDSRRIATASADNTVRVWEATTGRAIATLIGHTDMAFSVVFSQDGERIVSLGHDGTARLWGIDGKLFATLTGRTDNFLNPPVSRDATLVALGDSDGGIKVWNIFTNQLVATLSAAGTRQSLKTEPIVFSPDANRIAVIRDRTVQVWSIAAIRQSPRSQ